MIVRCGFWRRLGKAFRLSRWELDLDRTGHLLNGRPGLGGQSLFSSGIISMASRGHTTVQIPHPLQ
jgi:hypothetical protein